MSLTKKAGSGSIFQWYGFAGPDPDPYQNFMNPQYWQEQSQPEHQEQQPLTWSCLLSFLVRSRSEGRTEKSSVYSCVLASAATGRDPQHSPHIYWLGSTTLQYQMRVFYYTSHGNSSALFLFAGHKNACWACWPLKGVTKRVNIFSCND